MREGYSLSRAITKAIESDGRGAGRYGVPRDGLEREVSDEIAERTGRAPRGFYVPLQVQSQRSLTTDTGAGSLAKHTAYEHFIDALRARMVTATLGAKIGDFGAGGQGGFAEVRIPMIANAGNVHWIGGGTEGDSPNSQAEMTTDALEFSPHTVGGFVDLTRKMRHSSSPDFDAHVWGNLGRSIGQAVDKAALVGTGEDGEPGGLLVTADPLGNGISRADLLAMEEAIANGNVNSDFMGLVTTPSGRALMRAVDVGGGNGFLWGDDNRVLGYPALATTALSDELEGEPLIFGDWSSVYIQVFQALDVLVDSYTFSTSGTVRITAFMEVDIQVANVGDCFRAVSFTG